ncbi:hypothetical protein Tco_0398216 [Tanacetum coccineum]
MKFDIFTYELGVVEDFYFPCVEQQLDNSGNGNLDVYEQKVCYDECEKIYVEAVIFINKRLLRLIDVTVKQWLDLKYGDHKTIDEKIKNGVIATWLIRSYKRQFKDYIETKKQKEIRGDDEEVLTDEELSDLEEEKLSEGYEIAEIFKIETNIFDFETPMCEAFKEFNYLFKIDVDLWSENGEPTDDIDHVCKPFRIIRIGNTIHFQGCEWYEGLKDGELKEEALKEKAILEGSWGHENRKGMNLCAWLKQCFRNYHELDHKLLTMLQKYWWGIKDEEESRTTNDDDAVQADQGWFDNHEAMEDNDDDIRDLDDYLVHNDAPFIVEEEDGSSKERGAYYLEFLT